MPQNPPENCQRIVPYLAYDDAPAAIEYLCRVFGFERGLEIPMGDGLIGHAEVHRDGETLMLSTAYEEVGLASPSKLPARHAGITVYVDDVDAHYAVARAEGAEIVQELADQFYGDRVYRAADCEGNHWDFHQKVRDVTPDEMMAALAAMSDPSEAEQS